MKPVDRFDPGVRRQRWAAHRVETDRAPEKAQAPGRPHDAQVERAEGSEGSFNLALAVALAGPMPPILSGSPSASAQPASSQAAGDAPATNAKATANADTATGSNGPEATQPAGTAGAGPSAGSSPRTEGAAKAAMEALDGKGASDPSTRTERGAGDPKESNGMRAEATPAGAPPKAAPPTTAKDAPALTAKVVVVAAAATSGTQSEGTGTETGAKSDSGTERGAGTRTGTAKGSAADTAGSGATAPPPVLPAGEAGRASIVSRLRADASELSNRLLAEGGLKSDPETGGSATTSGSALRSASRVVLDFTGENGIEGRLRVALRGSAIHATIISADRGTAERLDGELGALQRALATRGFTQSNLSVQHGRPASSSEFTRPNEHEAPHSQEKERGRKDTAQGDGSDHSWNEGSRHSGLEKGKRE